jgi:hypothetical protein
MKFHGQEIPDPRKPFGPYDLESTYDRCINCEAIKKIVATITLDQKPGPMCRDCFILHKK